MSGKAGRGDHEVVRVGNRPVPILGTVGGTPEQSRQTAKNIENYFGTKGRKVQAKGSRVKQEETETTVFCGCTDGRACAGGCHWSCLLGLR
jgi:hypothetical protein